MFIHLQNDITDFKIIIDLSKTHFFQIYKKNYNNN